MPASAVQPFAITSRMSKVIVETHMSNVHAREDFRSRSLLSGVCIGVVCGFGETSYKLAIDAVLDHLG